MRQTNIYDFIEEKDWIDKDYFVYKTFHKGEWTEYSPKFLTFEEAQEWRRTKGEQLCDRFGRKLKRFSCKPSDHSTVYHVGYTIKDEYNVKTVPGEDFIDACANLELFMDVDSISLGFKKKH